MDLHDAAPRQSDVYAVLCRGCDNSGTLTFWRDDHNRWGTIWVGFSGREALISMPRRARGRCSACGGRHIEVGDRLN
jgi:hypothetical protein